MPDQDVPPAAGPAHWRELLPEGAGITGWLDGPILRFVCHNGGRGLAEVTATITHRASEELTAEADGVELVLEGDPAGRFQAVVQGADEDLVMLVVVGPAPPPVRVRYRGGPDHFETRGRAGPGPWPAAMLGVTSPALGNRLNEKTFQPLDQGPGAPGHWLLDAGSLDDFIDAVESTAAEAQQRRQQREAQQWLRSREDNRDTHFVNPYTFVALPAGGPVRSAPPGHDRCSPSRPLVRMSLTWEARTPLVTRTAYGDPDGRSGLAGSAVKGAVRSLHEALTGSCLRIADLDSAPGHRESMDAGQGRRLARIHQISEPSDQGDRTVTLELARQTVWVDSQRLPVPLTPGQPCDVSGVTGTVEFLTAFGRYQVRPDEAAGPALAGDPGLAWIPLLSSTGARSGHRYYVALGAFPPSPADPDLVQVGSRDPAWQRYDRAAAGSEDARVRHRGETVDLQVRWRDRVVGTRQPVRSALAGPDALQPGHLLWVTVDAGRVAHLAAAYVWRRGADQPARQRVPDGAGPCTDPASLCPSCQVFGSGGEPGQDGQDGEAGHGYRGHVRFGPMTTDAVPEVRSLAPLNAPSLGAGQFYLAPPDAAQAKRGEIPLREWGSGADAGGARRLRGRKFYWPADPDVQRERRRFLNPRWQVEQVPYRQLQGRGQPARVWPAETVFHQTVTVAGLDRAQLGSLLAALRPDLLAGPTGQDWACAVVRMGYGKPFGLGVLRARSTEVTVQTPDERYGSGAALPRPVPDDELVRWVAEFVESAREDVRAVWPDLRAVTDPDHVWPEFVTYPVDRWEDYPQDGSPSAGGDYTFQFWRESVGNHRFPLVALREARDPDQLLPLRPGEAAQ